MIETIFGTIASIIALATIQATMYIRRREFEDIYVQRFWTIHDRIPTKFRVELQDPNFEFSDEDLNEDEKKVLWDYLMLCEDELDLRKQGQVTDETWDVWRPSITGSLNRYPFLPMFNYIDRMLAERIPNEDQRPFQNLRDILKAGEDYKDPWPHNRFFNFLTGRREILSLFS